MKKQFRSRSYTGWVHTFTHFFTLRHLILWVLQRRYMCFRNETKTLLRATFTLEDRLSGAISSELFGLWICITPYIVQSKDVLALTSMYFKWNVYISKFFATFYRALHFTTTNHAPNWIQPIVNKVYRICLHVKKE